MSSIKKNIAKYVLELLIVTFGVVLGFGITDYRNNRTEEVKIKQSLNLIKKELEDNKSRIEHVRDYHESLDSSIAVFIKDKDAKFLAEPFFGVANGFNQIPNWNGPGIPSIEDYAFETARSAQLLAKYDLKTSRNLTRIYKYLENYGEITNKVMDKIFELNNKSTNEDVLFLLELLSSDIHSNEVRLVKSLEKVISKFD